MRNMPQFLRIFSYLFPLFWCSQMPKCRKNSENRILQAVGIFFFHYYGESGKYLKKYLLLLGGEFFIKPDRTAFDALCHFSERAI